MKPRRFPLCPHCGSWLILDYMWDDEGDEVAYYYCRDCNDFNEEDDMEVYRLLRMDDAGRLYYGPVKEELARA